MLTDFFPMKPSCGLVLAITLMALAGCEPTLTSTDGAPAMTLAEERAAEVQVVFDEVCLADGRKAINAYTALETLGVRYKKPMSSTNISNRSHVSASLYFKGGIDRGEEKTDKPFFECSVIRKGGFLAELEKGVETSLAENGYVPVIAFSNVLQGYGTINRAGLFTKDGERFFVGLWLSIAANPAPGSRFVRGDNRTGVRFELLDPS